MGVPTEFDGGATQEAEGRYRGLLEAAPDAMVVVDEAGEIVLLNVQAEKQAAEQHLLQAEGRYRGLLEAAPDAMVVVDQAGEIVLLNVQAEKQFGYQRDELVGQPVTNIIPEGFAERLIADDLRSSAEALAQQIGTGIELSARRKDGTEFPIEIMLSPLDSAEGILVTAAIRDISVRKAVENELLQAQKLESIGRLAGGIAHDFNNMLSIIRGYAELLDQDLSPTNRDELDPDHALRSVQAISGAADRAAVLTAQLLAFSRQQVVKSQVLDLNGAVKAIEPMLGQLIGRKVHLRLKLDGAAGNIRADPGQIDQIVVNLVVNARDAMPDGGTVTIETSAVAGEASLAGPPWTAAHGPYVLLAVTDTGVGMDQTTLQHVFEPFFTTKDVGDGTGLGLATTHGIVHHAGGYIALDSKPGRGSAFRLYFPRIDAAAEEPSRTLRSPGVVGVGRVLVVEDEPDLRHLITELLQRAGYEVLPVSDGAQALALATLSERFDALVTDVVMPNLSGIELAERMMALDPTLGVVMLSGYIAETLDLERVTAAGATFMQKPITSARLLEAVREAVESRHAAPVAVR
jgi:PAS domain S-box-containing protein